MGTWSTSIDGNDDFCIVYERYFELYNEGIEINVIKSKLYEEFFDIINMNEVANEFWFALSKALWECKALDKEILDKVKTIIQSGDDISIWRSLGGTENQIAMREKVLKRFLEKILKEKEKAKKRTPKYFSKAIFRKGDCIAFKMKNGNYGGAIVLDEKENEEEQKGYNFIVKTKIDKPQIPTIADFENTELLLSKVNLNEKTRLREIIEEEITWFSPKGFSKFKKLFKVIGNISSEKVSGDFESMTITDSWDLLIIHTEELLDEQLNVRNCKGIKLYELLNATF
jgi:hypothetical protein